MCQLILKRVIKIVATIRCQILTLHAPNSISNYAIRFAEGSLSPLCNCQSVESTLTCTESSARGRQGVRVRDRMKIDVSLQTVF